MTDSNVDDLTQDDGENDLPAGAPATDAELEAAFNTGRLRVVQDRNDFFLPHVVDFLEGRKWGNLTPEYQRRLRWDDLKKSRLIESFIMNVPVPPVFLYEKSLGTFEVLDGQQRLNTIRDYLTGKFPLSGLKLWPALNDRRFADLPPLIRTGLERAKVSAIILTSDNSTTEPASVDLRAQVFHRLNTGGERLNPQELRNSLYSGPFNDLIVDLAGEDLFTRAWEIPNRGEHTRSDGSIDDLLKNNSLFKRMLDCEIVLRFFAFRDDKHVSGSVKSILDDAAARLRNATEAEVKLYRTQFLETLSNVIKIFGKDAFRIQRKKDGRGVLSRPLYDAQMIAVERMRDRVADLAKKRSQVVASVKALTAPESESYPLMVGRANTADAIKKRIEAVEAAMRSAL